MIIIPFLTVWSIRRRAEALGLTMVEAVHEDGVFSWWIYSNGERVLGYDHQTTSLRDAARFVTDWAAEHAA